MGNNSWLSNIAFDKNLESVASFSFLWLDMCEWQSSDSCDFFSFPPSFLSYRPKFHVSLLRNQICPIILYFYQFWSIVFLFLFVLILRLFEDDFFILSFSILFHLNFVSNLIIIILIIIFSIPFLIYFCILFYLIFVSNLILILIFFFVISSFFFQLHSSIFHLF